MKHPSSSGRQAWYESFFNSPDSLWLGAFPDDETSRWEAEAVAALAGLRAGQVVVDVPCGPGRHIVHWARMGCWCVGADLSETMLEMARRRAAEEGVEVRLVRARMERLPLRSGIADAVLNLFNSFGYLDDAHNAQVLEEAARVLKPGGVFVLDTRNPIIQILCAPYGEETELADGRVFVARAHYRRETKRLHVVWHQIDGPGRYEASIRLYSLAELEALFERAGLEVTGTYGDFDGASFTGDEAQMILVGRTASGR